MTTVTLHRLKRSLRPTKKGGPRSRVVWQLRWYGTDGRRYAETIGDLKQMSKRDADAIRREKQTGFDSDRENPVAPDKITVSDLIEQYVAAHASTWRPKTRAGVEAVGRHLEAAVGSATIVSDFDGRSVKRVLDYLEKPRKSGGSGPNSRSARS